MRLTLSLVVFAVASVAYAQNAETPPPDVKIVVVPYPGEHDAGTPGAVTQEAPPAPPPVVIVPVAAPATPPPTPAAAGPVETPPPPPPAIAPGAGPESTVPGAFLDGHPREGAFLSGPGSLTFILHHTLMLGVGGLMGFMIPNAINGGLQMDSAFWVRPDARIEYLAGGLIGAAVGFGTTAWWQFNHWQSTNSANFGMINSFFGSAFLGGIADLARGDLSLAGGDPSDPAVAAANKRSVSNAYAVAWSAMIGGAIGGWLSTIVGGGDLPTNHGLMIASGGAWAMIYTALALGIMASTGGQGSLRTGIDVLMITPAIGAGIMALATLKFNPSTNQIIRADLFGIGVGAALLLIAAAAAPGNFVSPIPYVVGGVGAAAAKVVVSLLWAEAAENPSTMPSTDGDRKRYTGVW